MNRLSLFTLLLCLWGAWNWYSHRPVKHDYGVGLTFQDDTEPAAFDSMDINTPPLQSDTKAQAFEFKDYRVEPKADFLIRARVLSREDYSRDRESDLVPIDLALGWGGMADSAVFNQLDIKQSGRFYFWHYQNAPPIPPHDIITSSANMHLIPSNPEVERSIRSVEPGQVVSFKGYLVNVKAKDGWEWRSSLSREDSGKGACELIFVKALRVE